MASSRGFSFAQRRALMLTGMSSAEELASKAPSVTAQSPGGYRSWKIGGL
jgi:hypothetical protein